MTAKLTDKQSRFVEEYLVDLNATQAAIRAGYAKSGARTEGTRLLANADIQEAVTLAQQVRSERTDITQDMVLAGLLKEAQLEGDASSHSSRVAAWAHLGKHLGMFVERAQNRNVSYVISSEPMTLEEWKATYCTEH